MKANKLWILLMVIGALGGGMLVAGCGDDNDDEVDSVQESLEDAGVEAPSDEEIEEAAKDLSEEAESAADALPDDAYEQCKKNSESLDESVKDDALEACEALK